MTLKQDWGFLNNIDWCWDGEVIGGNQTGYCYYPQGPGIPDRRWKWHKFTSSGSLSVNEKVQAHVLVIAGGGASGPSFSYDGGGGGAGALFEKTDYILTKGYHYAEVGGGASGSHYNGYDTIFDNVVCLGGGYGGPHNGPGADGGSGGGGGTRFPSAGGKALGGYFLGETPSYAFDFDPFFACDGADGTYHLSGGGGGGASGVPSVGNGARGRVITIAGTTEEYAMGGSEYRNTRSWNYGGGATSIFNAWAYDCWPGIVIIEYAVEPPYSVRPQRQLQRDDTYGLRPNARLPMYARGASKQLGTRVGIRNNYQ